MVLKRPYLILIKYFRLIHLVMAIFSAYCIYKMNFLLKFFNEYLVNDINVIGNDLQGTLFSAVLFAFTIIILFVSIILLFTMLSKKKTFKFYLYNTVAYLFILILLFYSYSFLGKMETSLIDILVVRVLRDLFLISLFVQGISLIYFFIRIIGLDLKKFDFMSDVESYNLDSDNLDEIEVSFDFDSNERRRIRKQKLADLKFTFRENRFIIICVIIIVLGISAYLVYSKVYLANKTYNQGELVNSEYYNIRIDNSYILNTSKNGKKITNNYLVVVDVNIMNTSYYKKFISGNLKLHIGDNIYNITNNYNKYLTDLGSVYENEEISLKGNNYLFVFEVNIEDIKKDMIIYYYDNINNIKIKLKPQTFKQEEKKYNLNDELDIDSDSFVIKSYDIQDKMIINYELCLSNGCYQMKQNIVPTLDTNYDKVIMKLEGTSKYANDSKFKGFSKIIANLGYIEYDIGGNTYISNMTRFTNLKKEEENIYYYEVDKNIMNADNIFLVLNTRKFKYNIILK